MSQKASSISVLGAGSWGSALSILLARSLPTVYLWDRDNALLAEIKETRHNRRYLPEIEFPKNIIVCDKVADLFKHSKIILLVIPSHAFVEVLQTIKPYLTTDHHILWATKGLEPSTGSFLHQVVERELNIHKNSYAVISGPSFAKEVALGLPTAVVLAANDLKVADILATQFKIDCFSVHTTDDLIGVQLGGIVKNVLAVAVGISDGVKFGANARAALITRGLAEMMQLGKALGARRETLMGLAGCGDVILTCTDDQSRNRRFGLALGAGLSEAQALQQIGQAVEALYNIEQICHLAIINQIELPIAKQVLRIIKSKVPPKEGLSVLFK